MEPRAAVRWSFLTQIAQFVLYFVVSVTLSRILLPSDFGTFAIINIFIGFIGTIKDFGIGSFLINRQELTMQMKNSVFLINLIIITILCSIIIGSSPFIAHFYNDDRLKIFIPLCTISLFVDGLTTIPDSILQKNLDFNHLFVIRTTAQVAGGGLAVYLALHQWGVYSLIFQSICISTISFILLYIYYPFVPTFRIHHETLRHIFSFCTPVFFDSIVQFWTRNIDNLLVGKIFGPAPLGIYNRAYTLMQLPTANLSSVITRVLFPYLSRIQEDLVTAAAVYVKTIRNIAFVSFPAMALLFIESGDLIYILYGNKWQGVAPLLRIFSIAGAMESILYPTGSLFLALGKTGRMFRINSLVRIAIILFIVAGSFYSVTAIAFCYLIAAFITAPFVMNACCRLLHLSMTTIIRNISPALFVTVFAALVAFGCRYFLWEHIASAVLRFIATVAIFGLVYLSLSFKFQKQTIQSFLKR